MTINTERLFLVPSTLSLLEAIVREDWPALSAALGGVDIADHWMHFPEAMTWMRDYLREHPGEYDWWNYLIIHRRDVRLVGACGYKGPPTPEGIVEIGYEIAESYQGQGLATETARALVEHAFAREGVAMIVAHTLAEENASVGVLRKTGFRFAGEEFDLDDGKIWRWEMGR